MNDITERQIEVMTLVCNGLTSKEIANELNITVDTVKSHVGNLLRQLNANSRTHAVYILVSNGVIPLRSL